MRSNRSRITLAGVLALALGAFAGPGVAQAAKVSEKAGPVTVPDAVQSGGPGGVTTFGENSLTFKLSGKKVKKQQILDVDLILNATGVGLGDLNLVLTKSKIGSQFVRTPGGTVWSDLEFSDQSNLVACNPANTIASNCNYLQGGTTYTGDLNTSFNPVFKGGNPKGTWTLSIQDQNPDNPAEAPATVSAELEVKTGAKFAKD